jgi:hypothetical protein
VRTRIATALFLGALLPALSTEQAPKGLSNSDWSSIRAAYDTARHAFHPQPNSTFTAHNPGLNWNLTFDSKGFTATSADNTWSWGLELQRDVDTPVCSPNSQRDTDTPVCSPSNHLSFLRTPQIEEWFINDPRGLEQGWTLSAPATIHLRVRGNLPTHVSPQSISFGSQLTYSGLKAWDANGKTVPTHFAPTAEGFAVRYDDSHAIYPITIDPLAQSAYLKASNTESGDQFGYSVAVSGDTVVVGAFSEASNTTGVNSIPNESADGAGAAYVFVRSGSSWSQQAYLKASNAEANDAFGASVAISGDTIIVGAVAERSSTSGINSSPDDNLAENAGAAYIFIRSGTSWTQQAYLKASNAGAGDQFGYSVAVSGNTVVVGANAEDSDSNSINSTPNEFADAAGAAYVFVRSGSSWLQQAYLKANNTGTLDQFGISVAVSGDTVVVGAVGEDSSISGVNSSPDDNLAENAGAAYVFVRSISSWSQQARLKASNRAADDGFGFSVAVSGDAILVGAPGEDSSTSGVNSSPDDNLAENAGAAYVFVRAASSWSQQAYLKASNSGTADQFGWSVAVSGDTAVVGAVYENSSTIGINSLPNDSASEAGAAYVFARSGSSWYQQAYLKATNTESGDFFGEAVSVSGNTIIVGARYEDSSTRGVNSSPDNDAFFAGAAYIFDLGEALNSLGKTSYSVPGTDLALGTPGFGALSPTGETLFESSLLGSGSSNGRSKAMFSSSIAGPTDIVLQTGSLVSGVAGLPLGTKIATVTNAVHNSDRAAGLFQATVIGSGINSTNNRLLFLDNGAFITPIRRSGLPINELGGAIPSVFREVLQQEGAADQIALTYTLKSGSGVMASNNSGLLLLSHDGTLTSFNAREGNAAFGAPGNVSSGALGQFNRAAVTTGRDVFFTAKFIPAEASPLDALFHVGSSSERNIPLQGEPAGDTTLGEKYRVFTGLTQIGNLGLLRATLTGGPASGNEGIWNSSGGLLLRKGQAIGGGLLVTKIVRAWGLNGGQVIAHVQLNDSTRALLLRQTTFGTLQILLRTGQPAPGIGLNKVTLATFQAIDVDPINGHYAILGSLKGAATIANQALWSGQTSLGNDTTEQFKRLPRLRLQKGDHYSTEATPGDLIRSIALKPAVDPSGVGGRGLAQQINSSGQILLTLTGDRKIQELVRLTP